MKSEFDLRVRMVNTFLGVHKRQKLECALFDTLIPKRRLVINEQLSIINYQ